MAELTFAPTKVKYASGATGINDWKEINTSPMIEVFRVTSGNSGDFLFCKKIHKVAAVLIHNHGATFATGVSRDNPRVTVTSGGITKGSAKITIVHSATDECFSIMVIGE